MIESNDILLLNFTTKKWIKNKFKIIQKLMFK